METEISVIIPSYNNEKYMNECIDSVLNQSFTDFEIVVCDDHSTDGTYDILMQYQRTHDKIKVIRNEKNMGVTPSRHRAILQSQGKYITTLDHDDVYLSKDKLLNEISLIQRFKEIYGNDVCSFSDVIIINDNGEPIKSQWDVSEVRQGNIFEDIITRSGMIPRDFLFLRDDYYRIGGYDPKLKLYEDWDLKIRLAHLREFYYTGQPGTGYRRVGTGFSYAFPKSQHIKLKKFVFRKNARLISPNRSAHCKAEFKKSLDNNKLHALNQLRKQFRSNLKNRNYGQALPLFIKLIRLGMISTSVN